LLFPADEVVVMPVAGVTTSQFFEGVTVQATALVHAPLAAIVMGCVVDEA
jgi:hypothetical protein